MGTVCSFWYVHSNYIHELVGIGFFFLEKTTKQKERKPQLFLDDALTIIKTSVRNHNVVKNSNLTFLLSPSPSLSLFFLIYEKVSVSFHCCQHLWLYDAVFMCETTHNTYSEFHRYRWYSRALVIQIRLKVDGEVKK